MSDSGSESESDTDFDVDVDSGYDPEQEGAELDENVPPDYPPDRPLGLYDEEATGLSAPGADDDTEPEVWEREEADADIPVLEGDADVGESDDEADLVARPVEGGDAGPLAEDDQFTGDETRRDVATEHVPPPAEEAAVRYDEDPPGTTG